MERWIGDLIAREEEEEEQVDALTVLARLVLADC